MGKLVTYLFVIIVILLGIPNFIFCMSYVFAKSNVNGSPTQTEKIEIVDDILGYSINYNLNDGNLVEKNPDEYNLFTPTFTLNNPVKDNYEFIGWTGSNGDVPQLTITVCEGSCGDLEFVANYKAITYLKLENTTLKWGFAGECNSFDIYINNELITTVTDVYELDARELEQYFVEGENDIYVSSNNLATNTVKYIYYDLTNFEDVTLVCNFERQSDKFLISYEDYVSLSYLFADGSYSLSIAQGISFPEDWSDEEKLLNSLNEDRYLKSRVSFIDMTMLELLETINNKYIDGMTETTIDLSGALKFNVLDTAQTEFVPNKITLKVNYANMYNEQLFYDGATINLFNCDSYNQGGVLYAINTNQLLTDIYLRDIDETDWTLSLDYNIDEDSYDYKLTEAYYTSDGTRYTSVHEDDELLNELVLNCKFYLNSNYYFSINNNGIKAFVNYVYSQAKQLREEYDNALGTTSYFGSGDKTFVIDVTDYFDVYSNEGVKQTIDYKLIVDVLTTTNVWWPARV